MKRFKQTLGRLLLIVGCCLSGSLPCRATSLVLRTTTSDSRTIALGEIQTIDFGAQYVSIALTNGTKVEVPVADFVSLRTDANASAIIAIPASPENLVWAIYDLNGHYVGEATEATLSQTALPQGVYILKSGSKALKVYIP